MIALRRGDTDEAARRFQLALELAPSDVDAMSNLGFLEAMRGNDAGAQSWYERAIAVDPLYPHVHRRLADLFYDREDYARALEYYRRVLAVIPTYFEALVQAGNCARLVGDVPTATAYYDTAERVRPDSWVPPYNLACLRALNGAPEEALVLLGTAVDRGLVARDLLDRNEDLDTVRTLPGWPALVERAERAAESQAARG
jgi:Flp pilus assembly protein TadD